MTDDIVARLRSIERVGMPSILSEAIDEIERLRVIVQGWENSARNAERDISELRAENAMLRRKLDDLELNCQHSTALVAHYVRKVERLEGRNAVQE